MSSLARLAALDGRRRALVVRAFAWVCLARALLAAPAGPLPRRQRWLDRLATRLPVAAPRDLAEAAWAVTAAARRVPGARCLDWALALRGLLAQAGIASELRIGVAAGDGPRAIAAHAWVEAEGQTLSWGDAARYAVLRPRAAQS
jgi:hypothetical protein